MFILLLMEGTYIFKHLDFKFQCLLPSLVFQLQTMQAEYHAGSHSLIFRYTFLMIWTKLTQTHLLFTNILMNHTCHRWISSIPKGYLSKSVYLILNWQCLVKTFKPMQRANPLLSLFSRLLHCLWTGVNWNYLHKFIWDAILIILSNLIMLT